MTTALAPRRRSPRGRLERLRAEELGRIAAWLPPASRVLEIGGGSGYQASLLAEMGHDVTSIDLADRPRSPRMYFDVIDYGGGRLPGDDGEYTVVYSSNVLEHVRGLDAMLGEIRRVLRADGVAIHVMPSASWRLWTTLSYVPAAARRLVRANRDRVPPARRERADADGHSTPDEPSFTELVAVPFRPHGEFPSAAAELFAFTRTAWRRRFERNGFAVQVASPLGLFYTGNDVLPWLGVEPRTALARLLGSSTSVFVTRPAAGANAADGRRVY